MLMVMDCTLAYEKRTVAQSAKHVEVFGNMTDYDTHILFGYPLIPPYYIPCSPGISYYIPFSLIS
jgi:hypothetical protein